MTTPNRKASLRRLLTTLRNKAQAEVQGGIRDGRTSKLGEVGDDLEHSDAGLQEGIALSLLQMRVERLSSLDAALARLEAGKYGQCFECGHQIAEARLHAVPFAVRCKACEGRRERAANEQHLPTPRSVPSLDADVIGS